MEGISFRRHVPGVTEWSVCSGVRLLLVIERTCWRGSRTNERAG